MNYAELKHKISFLEHNTVCMNEYDFISIHLLFLVFFL